MKKIQTTVDIPAIVKIAEGAAREAGAYLLQKLGAAKVEHRKSLRDDVLDADLQAEQLIVTRLRKELPHIGMLSEESGQEGEYDHYWIVDPLDGSANFQHGSPLFAIAIALVLNRVPQASIVYLPAQNEMFTAIQHQGAFLNGKRVHVSSTSTIEQAIIHVGDFSK